MTQTRRYSSLLLSLALVGTVAVIGSLFTARAIPDWYGALERPAWTPPNWLFGPVWTLLYAMMAVAAWLVYLKGGFAANRTTLVLYLTQLLLNALWTPLFFGAHLLGMAFFEIVLLWVLIVATIAVFFRVRALSGWLMVPYLVWVSYASALNFAIWRLNS